MATKHIKIVAIIERVVHLCFRHARNLRAFCLSEFGVVSPPISEALAFDALERLSCALAVADLAIVELEIPFHEIAR